MTDDANNSVPAELKLTTIDGDSYSVRDWLTSYPFLLVAIDPYTIQSSWILDTASRIFDHYAPADIRVGWICAADEEGCREFLGPLADRYLTFCDPESSAIDGLRLNALPSLVHIRSDGFLQLAESWDPKEWEQVCDWVSKIMAWTELNLGKSSDPNKFVGTSARETVRI